MDPDELKRILDGALEPVKETQKSHGESLETLKGAVVSIESKLDAYGDMYKINRGNIERLDERLTTAEDKLEIQPSDQLAIQR